MDLICTAPDEPCVVCEVHKPKPVQVAVIGSNAFAMGRQQGKSDFSRAAMLLFMKGREVPKTSMMREQAIIVCQDLHEVDRSILVERLADQMRGHSEVILVASEEEKRDLLARFTDDIKLTDKFGHPMPVLDIPAMTPDYARVRKSKRGQRRFDKKFDGRR